MPADTYAIPVTVSDPGRLSVIAKDISAKKLSPVELVERYLARIEAVEPQVHAWRELDRDRALAVAQMREDEAGRGVIHGPLHGIPIAVKDIIDVAGLPTRCNSCARSDAKPATVDAEVVLQLKTQGAIVLGKVHTTEYAYFDPSPACNPWNTNHTPGGSSSGSGAAVAAGMAPLALGTQTIASVNRPAAYCGVSAFKPSSRSQSMFGVAPLAASYDTMGFFGTRVEDAVFAFEAAAPPFMQNRRDETGKSSFNVVLLNDPLISGAHSDMKAAHQRMADTLADAGHQVEDRTSQISFERLVELQRTTFIYEVSRNYGHFLKFAEGEVGARLLEAIRDGSAMDQTRYLDDRVELDNLRRQLLDNNSDVDLFLWPAAPSSAPEGLQWTGEPKYIAPWTAIGGPMVTIPAGLGDNGLPLACIACSAPGTDIQMCDWARDMASVCEVSPFDS